jgi:hypothetical protein
MEFALRTLDTISPDQFIQAVREIVAPLAVRFDGQDRAIERVEARVDSMAEDLASVKAKLFNEYFIINIIYYFVLILR